MKEFVAGVLKDREKLLYEFFYSCALFLFLSDHSFSPFTYLFILASEKVKISIKFVRFSFPLFEIAIAICVAIIFRFSSRFNILF